MGQEIACVAHFGGKTVRGKALLETAELLFRGEARLKIPFNSIQELKVSDGALRVKTADGVAAFQLGDTAEKWRDKILNPKSLVEKLGVKSGNLVTLRGTFDKSFRDNLIKHGAELSAAANAPWIFLMAEASRELAAVKMLAQGMQGATALWIVYPKGQKNITEQQVRAAGLKAGLTDVKVAKFSDTHTALKFVIPKSKR